MRVHGNILSNFTKKSHLMIFLSQSHDL